MTVTRAIGWEMEGMPRIVRGEGSYLYDAAGKRYLDGSGGPAAFCLGHANREVNEAIGAQLAKVACGYRYLFTSEPLEQLTRLLLEKCGPQFGHIVFSSSGSEAIESAMKVALQYWDARGQPEKHRFIARDRSYHGSTLGALSLSGFAERRKPFVAQSAERLLRVCRQCLSAASRRERRRTGGNPGSRAGRTDPLPGTRNDRGIRVRACGRRGWRGCSRAARLCAAVREVCNRHEVLLIADEVMSGSGRCGTWCALSTTASRRMSSRSPKGLRGLHPACGDESSAGDIAVTRLCRPTARF